MFDPKQKKTVFDTEDIYISDLDELTQIEALECYFLEDDSYAWYELDPPDEE